jgi:hypothetical protein
MVKNNLPKSFHMDMEYKKTDEYKEMLAYIKSECPNISDYFCDIAIHTVKTNPKIMKQYFKPLEPKEEDPNFVYDCVTIEDGGVPPP